MEQHTTTDSWLKLGEAAFALGVSEITLRRKIKSGKLCFEFRDGKYYILLRKDEVSGKFSETTEVPHEHKTTTLSSSHTAQMLDVTPDFGGNEYKEKIYFLETALAKKDLYIYSLKRTLEDQETLISALENRISN